MTTLPDIYLFNPTCDMAVANKRPSWQPNRLLRKMEDDLSTLPMFFCKQNDYVLTNKLPSPNFLNSFKSLEFLLPNFILKEKAFCDPGLFNQRFGSILPWGWSPAAHKLFEPLKPLCSTGFLHSPVSDWYPGHQELHSRKTALKTLTRLSAELPVQMIISETEFPVICKTRQEIENCIVQWGKIIIKAPWSSAGRGLQPITKTPVHPKVWEKIHGLLREQEYVMAEPFLEKVTDLAFLYSVKKGKVSFSGISYFLTDKKGQYQGNLLNGIPDNITPEIRSFVLSAINAIPGKLKHVLENSPFIRFHEGFFGVDALIYRDKDNQLKINPCLEINFRFTMGWLSLYLEKIIHQEKKGQFRTFYHPGMSFLDFTKEMGKKYPAEFADKRLFSGFFPITEAGENTFFGAYLMV